MFSNSTLRNVEVRKRESKKEFKDIQDYNRYSKYKLQPVLFSYKEQLTIET